MFAAAKRKKSSFPYTAVGDRQWVDDISLLSADTVKAAEKKIQKSDLLTLPFEGWESE